LQAKSAAALSDFELLQALIGSGNKQADVGKIAQNTLKLMQEFGADITYKQLQQVTGMGPARITEILAALELSRRFLIDSEQPIIDSPEKAVEQLADIRDKKQEHFVVMTLDGANRLIAKRIITIGTLTSSLVHPREVFADAITDRAASIIVAHNHPSGNPVASQDDINVSIRLQKVGEILGINMIDHLVVTKDGFVRVS
ncbi:DNA repair protein RadC, partial [Candidatus Saccharibacteria bacterium]|nr:DNA repair protein RadC [Candidatus Saccharibacteria bacterium]